MKIYEINENVFQVELTKNKAVVIKAKNKKESIKKAKLKKF